MKLSACCVVGIKATTTNDNMQCAEDIGNLWKHFMAENIADKIPNRIDNAILSVYHNYQGDHTQPYDILIGCRVSSLTHIPDGLHGINIVEGAYQEFIAKGDVTRGAVGEVWGNIWQSDLSRAYRTDFEVYGEKAQNPQDAEVSIFIGVNE